MFLHKLLSSKSTSSFVIYTTAQQNCSMTFCAGFLRTLTTTLLLAPLTQVGHGQELHLMQSTGRAVTSVDSQEAMVFAPPAGHQVVELRPPAPRWAQSLTNARLLQAPAQVNEQVASQPMMPTAVDAATQIPLGSSALDLQSPAGSCAQPVSDWAPQITCLAPAATSGLSIRPVPCAPNAFLPTPISPAPYDARQEVATYSAKYAVPVQRPWVEFWRPFYAPGIYPPAPSPLGPTNLLFPHFYVYGDYRTAVGVHRNQAGKTRTWAHRLNLDMDLQFTATERLHGFMGPLDKNNEFTRLDFTDDVRFETVTDVKFETLFFEGDVGAIAGGIAGIDSPFDLPFTFGMVPLLYQNGIWMEDAVLGAAVAVPARNSPALSWSNYDATFFAVSDQLTSDAFAGSASAAEAFGTAWFIDAYDGYIELDYAYVHDDVGQQRSYNNMAAAFTRRYFARVSNSVRFISNFGQNLPIEQRTADGYLVLLENSLISASPNTCVPYCNLFYGSGRPQSVARAVGSGGILRNTGINFETDALTGYPTLDATATNTYGAALGLNMLGANFRDQLVIEAAALGAHSDDGFRRVAGDQYATGVRYQRPLSYRCIFRTDAMYGWLRSSEDIVGSRMELRWKF